jgi:hypothetical protein
MHTIQIINGYFSRIYGPLNKNSTLKPNNGEFLDSLLDIATADFSALNTRFRGGL